MFDFATPRPRRRPSLTPMIDVVFLLLVFFMLASQFGRETGLALAAGGAGGGYSGPPRLVDIGPGGLRLNGGAVTPEALPAALDGLSGSRAETIVLRPGPGVALQRLVDVAEALTGAGFTALAVVE